MPTKKAHPQPKKIFRETDERTERMSDLECGHDVEDGEVWCPECGTHRKLRRAVVQPEPQIVELTRELERQTNCALISQAAFQRERDRAEAAEARLTVLEAHEGALPDVIALLKTIKGVNVVIINDAEARQLTNIPNLIKAAREILTWGPKALIVKRGEYGAALFTADNYFAIPAYPLESVFDPTGAGDTFAGGFMGYLSSQEKLDEAAMRRAMIFGSVMASFNVEEFGTDRVRRLTHAEINDRFRAFKRMTNFEEIPFERTAPAV